MSKSLPPAIFAVVMLGVGIAALLFPYNVRSAFLKLMGGKDESTYSLFGMKQTIPSIRFAGAVGILMAAFLFWAIWRSR